MGSALQTDVQNCYHCGNSCQDELIIAHDKAFCCAGCKTVFELLIKNDLCTYYKLEQNPSITGKHHLSDVRLAYLNDASIKTQLISFSNGSISKLTLYIPQMHSSSCIWLLENLSKLNSGISESKVKLLTKELSLSFFHNKTTLKDVVLLLIQLGYEPEIKLSDKDCNNANKQSYTSIYQSGITGFLLGNVILLAFLDYLALPYISITLAVLFIIFGLLFGIPYLNPELVETSISKIEMFCSKNPMIAKTE
jgi:P-type Cu+ transporter